MMYGVVMMASDIMLEIIMLAVRTYKLNSYTGALSKEKEKQLH